MSENPNFYHPDSLNRQRVECIKPQFNTPMWFAGMAEIRPFLIGFDIQQDRYTYPIISYSGEFEEVQRLQYLADGTTPTLDAHVWRKYSHKAVRFARLLQGLAPSRTSIINSYYDWEQTKNIPHRLAIARKFNAENLIDPVPESAYTLLVQDPHFVAGIIDGRGCIGTATRVGKSGDYDHTSNRLHLNSHNQPLLHALKHIFAGSISRQYAAGDEIVICGTPTIARQDSFQWQLYERDLARLHAVVGPYLQFPPNNSLIL